jgi:hypothetical protein
MAKGPLRRRKINPSNRVSITPIAPSNRFELFLGDEGYVSALDLVDLHDAARILRELGLFLRGRRRAKSVANEILRYLRHALLKTGIVCSETLTSYRAEIDAQDNITLNTKYQRFQTTKLFVGHLMSSGVISEQKLPRGFDPSKVNTKNKSSFAEIARSYVEDEENFKINEIEEVIDAFEIEHLEARALILSIQCIDLLHQESIIKIKEWEQDWEYVQTIISNLSKEEIAVLGKVKGINGPLFCRKRSAEEALSILYAKFGSEVPAVRYWPKGIEDFFRCSLGWSKISRRVSILLNGNSIDPEDVRLLRHVRGVPKEMLDELRTVESYRIRDLDLDSRSIELAISILYSRHGRLLPDSTSWPEGVADYLKKRGWNPNRVRSALFPSANTLTPFIVGLLSCIELSPNVDTVAQYAYFSSFKPASEEGKVAVFFDKYRGEPLRREVSSGDPIIAACVRHVARMKDVLGGIGDIGREILRKEKVPLWLHYTPSGKNTEVRPPEWSTVVSMVRRFIGECSQRYPVLKSICSASGENFRPTCALILKLAGGSSAKIQGTLGHRHSKTTNSYTSRIYTQSLLKTRMKNFQRYLIDTATRDFTAKDNVRFERSELQGSTNHGVDEWICCDAQRFWFYDLEIVGEWIAWERAISTARESLSYSNPARWEAYWEPRLVKYRNLLSMVSGVDLEKAKSYASLIVLPPLS